MQSSEDSKQAEQSGNGGQQRPPPTKGGGNGNPPPPQQQQQPALPQQQQQPWVAMQYPPSAAMLMQHPQMMAPPPPHHHQHYAAPHYMAYHQYAPPHQRVHHQAQQQQQNGENRTVWVGDLHHWMDENYLHSCFVSTGEIASIKVIRNKQTGLSEGYGFVEFFTHGTAEKVLQNYSGIMMPNTEQPFRLNWATFSTGDKRSENAPDLSIFVGDLAADVTDNLLHETFANKYPSVKAAKVVFDVNTGRSKGYGFVRFGDENERSQAMSEMNGVYCSSRPMRIGAATPRKSSGYQSQYSSQGGYSSNGASSQSFQSDGDSANTTIFVGGLDPSVNDEDLRQQFSQYGEIVSVKIPSGKGCGFVQFANRSNAEEALQKLNGTVIGKQTVRLSWGRNPANKQVRPLSCLFLFFPTPFFLIQSSASISLLWLEI
ncbi:hypothetical protein EUGRSUZ_F02369 [Eucalyptus grandis]|uniref:Uncharacterized protein n=2 Tax=Eucalyptus grandis TaxID=71139 RepID=A0ACC3KGI0_EUCGR|nr:hypothetical protein EUGRSUZ_F02369 [Eucalyptus grandis]